MNEEQTWKTEIFGNILNKMVETYKKKNHDYSVDGKSAFEDGFETFGITSVAVRLNDKVHRLKAYAKNKEMLVADENVVDTLLDAAVYSVLALVEIKYREELEKLNEVK